MMRLINIGVITALLLAAADVYKIKFDSTRQVQRLAKLRMDIAREQDAIAALRAEWAKLDNPARIQDFVRRHSTLKPIEARQFDNLDALPERPRDAAPLDEADPIGMMIASPNLLENSTTGSVPEKR